MRSIITAAFCLCAVGIVPANAEGVAASLIAGGAQIVSTATFNDGTVILTMQQGKRAWVCLLDKAAATYDTRRCYAVN